MLKISTTIAVCILLNTLTVSGLQCKNGHKAVSAHFEDELESTVTCPSRDQRCLRGEAIIEFIEGTPISMVVWKCVSAERCEEDCATLVEEISNNILGFGDKQYPVGTCKAVCCKYNNCNDLTVQTILSNRQQRGRTTAEPLQIQSVQPDVVEESYPTFCSSGLLSENTDNAKILCTSSEQFCLRQEVTIEAENSTTESYIFGSCANKTTCSQSCSQLALDRLGGTALSTQACEIACCRFDDCNSVSVSILQALTKPDSTTSAPSIDLLPDSTTAYTTKTQTSKPVRNPETTYDSSSTPDTSSTLPVDSFERTCLSGHQIPQFDESRTMSLIKCPSSQSYGCLRQELSLLVGEVPVNFSLGACVSEDNCRKTCGDIKDLYVKVGALNLPHITLQETEQYLVLSCETACCTSNDCNRQGITIGMAEKAVVTVADGNADGSANLLTMNKNIMTSLFFILSIALFFL